MCKSNEETVTQKIQPTPTVTTSNTTIEKIELPPFPIHGVKLSYLKEFLLKYNSSSELKGLTTTQVCESIVKPLTSKLQLSLCELLIHEDNNGVAKANLFISHAWKFEFLDVIEAIFDHLQAEEQEEEPIIWFDLFSNNQHQAINYPFEWWKNTFRSAINEFHRTIMIFVPWNNPIPLTRAWCIWELYCTISTNSSFEIAMSAQQKEKFINEIGSCHEQFNQLLVNINSENSEAWKLEDKQRIHQVVKDNIGFNQMNSLIFQTIQQWMIQTVKKSIKEVSSNNKKKEELSLTSILGSLYFELSDYKEALIILEPCYYQLRQFFNEDNHTIDDKERLDLFAGCLTTLALLYQETSQYKEAESIYQEYIQLVSKVLGKDSLEVVLTYNDIGRLKELLGNDHEALRLYQDCLQRCNNHKESTEEEREKVKCLVLSNLTGYYDRKGYYDEVQVLYDELLSLIIKCKGENHPDTLSTLSNYALYLSNIGNNQEAEGYYQQVYEKSTVIYGEHHSETMMVLLNLGVLYMENKERLSEAERIFHKLLITSKEVSNEENPLIDKVLSNIGCLYNEQGKYKEAEEILNDLYQRRLKNYGENHSDTILTLHNLAFCYLHQEEKQEKGVELFQLCLKKEKDVLGIDHPQTINSQNILDRLFGNTE